MYSVCACVTVCIVPLMGLLTGLGYLEGFDINFYFFLLLGARFKTEKIIAAADLSNPLGKMRGITKKG